MKLRSIAILTLLLGLAASLRAEEGGDDYARHNEPGRCRCHEGKATWSYLRSPLGPPEDPPYCGFEGKGSSCRNRPRPPHTSAACWGSKKEACFWKRHAWSWSMDCLTCLQDPECPDCDDLPRAGQDDATRLLLERLRAEQGVVKGDLWIVRSPHFYVVTNLHKKVKVRGRRGGLRLVSGHEYAHLAAQRCEIAYDEFVHWFGGTYVTEKPTAVFLMDRRGTALRVSDAYFGGNGQKMNYAVNYGERICGGLCGNGMVTSLEEQASDRKLHMTMRHQIGHILFSVWQLSEGFEKGCPRWAWIGAAHFLAKNLDTLEDEATYCYGEGSGGEGPTKKWLKRVRKLAKGDLVPIETYFHKGSLSDFQYEDHLRAWSLMDLMLREDRERWLKVLTALRHEADEGAALKEHLGLTSVQFHHRWVERLTGKRRTMGEEGPPEVVPEDPTRREREAIEEATDPKVLAGRIRGLDILRNPEVARVVAQRFHDATDLVRETIHNLLVKTTNADVLQWMRKEGMYDPDRLVRAGVIRALGAMEDRVSRAAIETMLDDREGLVRSTAATALQDLRDPQCRDALLAALDEPDPKTWIPIADAYASFGHRPFAPASKIIAKRLEDKRWQVRLTAAQALARVGTANALDPLIDRFSKETGRLEREFRAALKAITYDDLGPNPESWKAWWKQQKERHKGRLPPRPEEGPNSDAEGRYAVPEEEDDPTYYGKRFYSKSVCFVLDISQSMKINMEIRPEQLGQLGDVPSSGTRIDIARTTLVNALKHVDPRTRFRIVLFQTDVVDWHPRLELANKAKVHANARRLAYVQPKGETNFHGALRAALGLSTKSSLDMRLEQVPDTVFFLTDGRPTRGEIQTMPELVSWLKDVNRFAKLKIHVIALGDLNVDKDELQKLADAGSGTLIHVREK